MENKIFSKVYGWMFIGLLISFVTGYYVSTQPNIIYNLFNKGTFFILVLVELGLCIWLSAGINGIWNNCTNICDNGTSRNIYKHRFD